MVVAIPQTVVDMSSNDSSSTSRQNSSKYRAPAAPVLAPQQQYPALMPSRSASTGTASSGPTRKYSLQQGQLQQREDRRVS